MKKSDKRAERFRDDPRPISELIELTLAQDPESDDDAYWNLIFVLQHRLSAIFSRVEKMAVDSDDKVRDVAVTVLGQSGVEKKAVVARAVDLLLERLKCETVLPVLESTIFALGNLEDPRKIAPLAAFVDHASAVIRNALTHSLTGSDDPTALAALIKLSGDADDEVRNWATFGLGSETEVDTAEIRDALAARLEDANGEVRMEAVVGLLERGDARAVPVLVRELDSFGSEDDEAMYQEGLVLDALDAAVDRVAATGDKAWLPVVKRAQVLGLGDPESLAKAVERCGSDSA